MQATIELPKAFSVRDDHEFYPIEHLTSRLNPQLRVAQVATGVHIRGGCTVFWGLVYPADQPVTPDDVAAALREAGYDFTRNGSLQPLPISPAPDADSSADAASDASDQVPEEQP